MARVSTSSKSDSISSHPAPSDCQASGRSEQGCPHLPSIAVRRQSINWGTTVIQSMVVCFGEIDNEEH